MNVFTSLYDYVGFPGLGIGDFKIDSVAVRLGDNFEIKWYGVIITLGIIAAFIYTYLHAKRHSLILDDLIDLLFSAVIPGIIGARLYYVFFDYLDNPEKYDSFYDIIAVWEGGLAIYGGLIFGLLGVVVAMKIKKIRILTLLDSGFPGVLLAQAMGRWGNFFNTEAYGAETDIFCRMRLSTESKLTFVEVHPTFLYESLWNLIGCVILSLLYKKRKFDGQIFLMSVAWYGFGRMFIEGLRQDSLWIGSLRVSQVLAALLFVAATVILIVMFVKTKKRHVARCIYTSESPKYIPYEAENGGDGDYDYDINMLYAKSADKATDTKPEEAPAPESDGTKDEAAENDTHAEAVKDSETAAAGETSSTESEFAEETPKENETETETESLNGDSENTEEAISQEAEKEISDVEVSTPESAEAIEETTEATENEEPSEVTENTETEPENTQE